MKNPYSKEQRKWLSELENYYRVATSGKCMVANRTGNGFPVDPCEGPIGLRHAIARRHLQLIADNMSRIRANKEFRTFTVWPERYDDLQPIPISQFSTSKFACQKHDQWFQGIDAEQIDLAEPENLFKVVYRVVLHQCHLMSARWIAHHTATKTEEGWKKFKETAFNAAATDNEAVRAETEWRNRILAVRSKLADLKQRLVRKEWNSLEYRALLLASKPTAAGWGHLSMTFDLPGLHPDDLRRSWEKFIDLGYMVVIPQQDGHAIITACKPDWQFRVPEVAKIHESIPNLANPNEPYRANDRLKSVISRKLWDLTEIGMRESLYQSWSVKEQRNVQAWMKTRKARQRPLSKLLPSDLPRFF